MAGSVAEVDVEARERLEIPRVPERTRVHWFEPDAAHQLLHGLLRALAVAGDEYRRGLPVREGGTLGKDLCEHGVECLHHFRARHGLRDLLRRRRVVANGEAHE